MDDHLYVYGSDAKAIKDMMIDHPEMAEQLHDQMDFTVAEVVWACREEMAITLDDVLARRVRALYLDARAAIEMAPKVAAIMARELGEDEDWQVRQIEEFTSLAQGYYLEG